MGLFDIFETENDKINDARVNTLQRLLTVAQGYGSLQSLLQREKKFLDFECWMVGPVICFYDEDEELGERSKRRRRKRRRGRRKRDDEKEDASLPRNDQ